MRTKEYTTDAQHSYNLHTQSLIQRLQIQLFMIIKVVITTIRTKIKFIAVLCLFLDVCFTIHQLSLPYYCPVR